MGARDGNFVRDMRSPLVTRSGEEVEFGYELGADNQEDAAILGAAYADGVLSGMSPQQAAVAAVNWFRQQLARFRQQNGGGGSLRPQGGGRRPLFARRGRMGEDFFGGEDDLFGEDELDGVDEQELGAIDSELEGLAGDDDEVGADDADELGGLPQTHKKIRQLRELLLKLETKYNTIPARRRKKRSEVLARIEKVKLVLMRKENKAQKKAEKLAAKLGVPVSALHSRSGLAATGLTAGEVARTEAIMERGAADASMGINSIWGPRMPPAGVEVVIPFLWSGAPGGLFQKAAGGAGPTTLTATTSPISYADFDILGADIHVIASSQNEADLLFYATVVSWGISGGFSQVYGETPITHMGGQMGSLRAGTVEGGKSFSAMRQDSVRLGRTNTAQLTMNLYQQVANAATINVQVTGTLRARVVKDDNIRR